MDRSLIDSLPQPAGGADFEEVRRLVGASRTKAVVLDDDPTGTQTVHGVDVLADWSVGALSAALSAPGSCFYILTNTRSLPEAEAASLVGRITANLCAAGKATGVEFDVISRSDSTLRGHFAAELGAFEKGMGGHIDGKIVIPAFFEGGRYTVGNIHYVAEGNSLIPAAETEFARDKAFGYAHSDLTRWIEEKTRGAVPAASVVSIAIETLRARGGADSVRRILLDLPMGAYLVVNAAAYADLEVFTRGLLEAEALGKRYLFRTAASFVRVRAGIEPRSLLSSQEIGAGGAGGGLVIVGSYVGKTTAQLESLLGLPGVTGIELEVGKLVGAVAADTEVRRVAAAALAAMATGKHAVVFTSRGLTSAVGSAGDLRAGRTVSDALVAVVRAIPTRPRFLIAKGGITSSDIAVHGLGMRKATVLGQAAPGVPVWEMGPETRFPGMKLVVWPGNVGGQDALRDLVRMA
jgi:uncharacterized protein YgbK (DUF1537 family)